MPIDFQVWRLRPHMFDWVTWCFVAFAKKVRGSSLRARAYSTSTCFVSWDVTYECNVDVVHVLFVGMRDERNVNNVNANLRGVRYAE